MWQVVESSAFLATGMIHKVKQLMFILWTRKLTKGFITEVG